MCASLPSKSVENFNLYRTESALRFLCVSAIGVRMSKVRLFACFGVLLLCCNGTQGVGGRNRRRVTAGTVAAIFGAAQAVNLVSLCLRGQEEMVANNYSQRSMFSESILTDFAGLAVKCGAAAVFGFSTTAIPGYFFLRDAIMGIDRPLEKRKIGALFKEEVNDEN